MRKANQEITDPAVLEEILSGGQIIRLAMCDGGKPYLLPFNYGYRKGIIYIHSAIEGRKIDVLRKHPTVSFEVEDGVGIIPGKKPCNWSTRYRSVVGEGTAEIVTNVAGKREGMEVIMAQHGLEGTPEFDDSELSRMVLLKIAIFSMSGKQSSNWERGSGEMG
jgi:nitroimidazol reductase NimA-like FMN-containing flavoprotein (pyridoxamine 5'-phosphate oxidase superfamily)